MPLSVKKDAAQALYPFVRRVGVALREALHSYVVESAAGREDVRLMGSAVLLTGLLVEISAVKRENTAQKMGVVPREYLCIMTSVGHVIIVVSTNLRNGKNVITTVMSIILCLLL